MGHPSGLPAPASPHPTSPTPPTAVPHRDTATLTWWQVPLNQSNHSTKTRCVTTTTLKTTRFWRAARTTQLDACSTEIQRRSVPPINCRPGSPAPVSAASRARLRAVRSRGRAVMGGACSGQAEARLAATGRAVPPQHCGNHWRVASLLWSTMEDPTAPRRAPQGHGGPHRIT